ncbi:MAG TPA: hypothetical protein VMV10_18000 [Pirellulales bacterium]|nr:hypothetical protein [Pirellulales bacterium]
MTSLFICRRPLCAHSLIILALTGIASIGISSAAYGQLARRLPPRGPSLRNELPAKMADGVRNEVIEPIPLTAQRLAEAQEGVAQQIRDQVEAFRSDVKQVFPDEIDALSGTSKWRPEDRAALLKAIKSIDAAAVYEAWLEAQPADTTGAERIARQTAVKRSFLALEQSAEDGKVTNDDADALREALDKLAPTEPRAADLTQALAPLSTWVQIQGILDAASPDSAAIGKLPTGKVTIIRNPNLSLGTAIVLAPDTVMVGNRGRGGVAITKGNAAEALDLPVIADEPVRDAEGSPVDGGVLLINPSNSGVTVSYQLNGEVYRMESGMSQRLQPAIWTIEFDRGGAMGVSQYRLVPGTYAFTPTETGWELYKRRYDVTIDNTRNPHDFHFVVNGKPLEVRGGHAKDLASLYPIFIRYDRGTGGELVQKALNFSGTVEVGINAADNLWDIFPEEGNKKRTLEVEIF